MKLTIRLLEFQPIGLMQILCSVELVFRSRQVFMFRVYVSRKLKKIGVRLGSRKKIISYGKA